MDSHINDTLFHPKAPINPDANMASFPLRDDAQLILIHPCKHETSLHLNMTGSYFCISLTGELDLWQGSNRQQITTGKLHILRQPEGADSRHINFGAPVSLAVVIFFSTKWRQLCPQGPKCQVGRFLMNGNESFASVQDQTFDLDDNGLALARALLSHKRENDIDSLSAEQSVLGLLSWAYVRYTLPLEVTQPKNSLPPRMARKTRLAGEILRQRFDNPPTIAELSALVSLNESDLKRCFKCLFGNPIASYSRQIRMEAARDLLSHSTLDIARVALEVGFANPSQFARAFRLQYGINPAQYRRSSH
ncbi:MAG: helix-turn-helix transcriptional regulator [Rhizobiaceae bacterium]|nr:helix-turn-helix transcriptional regulator [Rhizobiaceae bacterium]